jgi:hypothetical protein
VGAEVAAAVAGGGDADAELVGRSDTVSHAAVVLGTENVKRLPLMLNIGKDRAYTAGILHDVGRLALLSYSTSTTAWPDGGWANTGIYRRRFCMRLRATTRRDRKLVN